MAAPNPVAVTVLPFLTEQVVPSASPQNVDFVDRDCGAGAFTGNPQRAGKAALAPGTGKEVKHTQLSGPACWGNARLPGVVTWRGLRLLGGRPLCPHNFDNGVGRRPRRRLRPSTPATRVGAGLHGGALDEADTADVEELAPVLLQPEASLKAKQMDLPSGVVLVQPPFPLFSLP